MNELVEVAVENCLRVARFVSRPVILDQLVGLEDVAPDLAAEIGLLGGAAFAVPVLAMWKFGVPAVRNMEQARENRIRNDLEGAVLRCAMPIRHGALATLHGVRHARAPAFRRLQRVHGTDTIASSAVAAPDDRAGREGRTSSFPTPKPR